MYYKSLLMPLLVQVALTFIVMFWMYSQRIAEFKAKRIHPESVKSRRVFRQKLTDSANSSDNFSNLFELPVLFYVAMLLAISQLVSDSLLVTLAWLFVLLRAVHSVIHCTYNTVIHRFYVFAASALVLLGLWVRLASILLIK